MSIPDDVEAATSETPQSSRVKMRMLEQMAEVLEDEAAGLYYRAAGFEEEEFLLNREIEERQTEINRLQLKLDALRSERDGVLGKIESVTSEAAEMREALYRFEQAFVFQSLSPAQAEDTAACLAADFGQSNPAGGSTYFRRLSLADSAR
ncbi:MAG TPA: hypothetical protein VJZ26_09385 [Blastocatellia bacterium]|nr:hypothetical protein [Blastocatellia bacterium]